MHQDRCLIARFKEVFTTCQITCAPQQGLSKERSMQVHSTCYKFISLSDSFKGSRIDLINKMDHTRHMNGIPWDSSVMSKVLTKQIRHVWWKLISTTWNTFEVKLTFKVTKHYRSLSVWVKWIVTILIGFGLFVWNLPALDSEPYHATQNSSQLCAEEGFPKPLEFSLTLVIILSNLLFLWLSLLIYEVNT